jgi:hypothetical protein
MIYDLSLSSNIFEDDLWSAALQELDILFSSVNTELIGYPNWGCNFEEYLWMMTPATGDLRQYISNKLAQTTFISQFLYNVSINYENNNYESIYHVLITLYNNDKSVQKEIQLGGKK